MSLSVQSGQTVSGTYRIMLNEGGEAQPWCPPGINGVDELSIVTAGKNLLPTAHSTYPNRGLSASINPDGSYHVTGTQTQAYANPISAVTNISLPPGTYTLSGRLASTQGTGYIYAQVQLRGTSTYITAKYGPETFKVGLGDVLDVSFTSDINGSTYEGDLYAQLELGSTGTAYEPPQVTTTPIDLDGHTLNSLPRGTCDELRIDGTGAVTLVKRTEQKTIDAEHPISVDNVVPASGTNLPYALVNMFTPFDSTSTSVDKFMFSTSWPYTENLKSRGVYRTWTSVVFVDERFTDKETAASIINEAGGTFVAQVPLSTEPLTAVTLPTLPSPNITVYNDSDVPSDITLEYERDVTIAFDKLQAQVSATTVREATNG